ncbi:hypothetical protein GVK96_01020 [Enterococcus hirae]|uniref:hypothetical protein n=1 Tax=Enterococcus hirae TaxID=1354 RepID=UPI001378535E|nr:hypothetical protein [Enterococcus hirae]NBA38101.1 hypothetical protein [Enterococcus hirae]
MANFDEKRSLSSKINVLFVRINQRQEQIKKVKRFSRIGRQERRELRHDKREFNKALTRYKEIIHGTEKIEPTARYFDNQVEQKRAIQEMYKNLSEKEAELFQKINQHKPFLPNFNRSDEAATFARELDIQIGKSTIGSEENKELKSLFHKIESSIEEEINDINNLHLKKLSRNQPNIQQNRSQETPEIQPASQRSMKMPSM